MIGTLAFLACPVVMIVLFRKFDLPVALVASLIGAYLLLPQSTLVNLPGLPPLDRNSVPLLTALILTIVMLRVREQTSPDSQGWIPRGPLPLIFMALFVFGAFMTVRTNGDALVYGDRVIQGLRLRDAVSILSNFFELIIAFCLGRRVLYSSEGQKTLLMGFAVAALCYSPLVLYEVRMSPQLHTQIYGFFPHSFAQHMRGSGFRPVVFLDHGLSLSLFLACSVLAAVGLMRIARNDQRLKWAIATAYLFAVMVLSKSLGPLLIIAVLMPFALFSKPRTQLLVAACVAGMVLTYPVLRSAHVIPLNQVTSFVERIDEQRAASFLVRLNNEEELLQKAQERPLYGWGIWGRGRIYDQKGNNRSITDGTWVLTLGSGGWVRYIAYFGLLCWPIIGLFFARRDKIDPVCATLALILCAKLVDIIPNSGVPPVYWLLAGTLLGRLEMKQGMQTDTSVPEEGAARPGYSRGAKRASGQPAKEPGYARRFPAKEAGTSATEAKPARDARPGLSYKRPSPSAGYRK